MKKFILIIAFVLNLPSVSGTIEDYCSENESYKYMECVAEQHKFEDKFILTLYLCKELFPEKEGIDDEFMKECYKGDGNNMPAFFCAKDKLKKAVESLKK